MFTVSFVALWKIDGNILLMAMNSYVSRFSLLNWSDMDLISVGDCLCVGYNLIGETDGTFVNIILVHSAIYYNYRLFVIML